MTEKEDERPETDLISLYLHGDYELIINRDCDSRKRVISTRRESFEGIILDLFDYHGKGLEYYNAKKANVMIHSGSIADRRIESYHPDLTKWVLRRECALPDNQGCILNEIVDFHNNFLSYIQSYEKKLKERVQ